MYEYICFESEDHVAHEPHKADFLTWVNNWITLYPDIPKEILEPTFTTEIESKQIRHMIRHQVYDYILCKHHKDKYVKNYCQIHFHLHPQTVLNIMRENCGKKK